MFFVTGTVENSVTGLGRANRPLATQPGRARSELSRQAL